MGFSLIHGTNNYRLQSDKALQQFAEVDRRLLIADGGIERRSTASSHSGKFCSASGRPFLEFLHQSGSDTLFAQVFLDHQFLDPGHATIGKERIMLEAETVTR